MNLLSETKRAAQEWVENGGKCIYRFGWAYRGASAQTITMEKAKELLPSYSFGMGFYELGWTTYNGETVLEFNELGENDLL